MDIFAAIASKDSQKSQILESLIRENPASVNEFSPAAWDGPSPSNYQPGIRPLMWATFVLQEESDAASIAALLNGMEAYAKQDITQDWRTTLSAMLNEIDFYAGRTALHWAAYNNNVRVYQMIKDFANARQVTLNYNQRDSGGKTPTQVALLKGFRNFAAAMAPARLAKAGVGPVHLAIIGMGATGTALFIRLIRGIVEATAVYSPNLLKNICFSLIDAKGTLGRGMAYSGELNSPTSILNVQASNMSIDGTEPNDFLRYIQDLFLNGDLEEQLGEAGYLGLSPVGPANKEAYYPRTFFGEYCTERLLYWIDIAIKRGITVNTYTHTVVSKVSTPDAAGLMTLELKGSEFSEKRGEVTGELISVTHTFNSTGHWDHKVTAPKPYEAASGCVMFPANRATLEQKGVFQSPQHVAVMGSSLSAIDAVFAVLLHPDVGHLEWVGNRPKYVSHQPETSPWRVTCYSRRGVWPKVRPTENRDVDAMWTSLAKYEVLRHAFNQGKPLDLNTCLTLVNNELAEVYKRSGNDVAPDNGNRTLPTALQMTNPMDLLPKGEERNPWTLVKRDVKDSDDGDAGSYAERPWVRWYQVVHGLFPVLARAYRGWNAEDRARFDKEINTPFLWAFAPMPLHSARVLLAMHEAGVLELRMTPSNEMPTVSADNRTIRYPYFDPMTGDKKYNEHQFLAVTTGLGSDIRLDPSELTQFDLSQGNFTLRDQEAGSLAEENTVFLANDDSYEFLDASGNHSPTRRGVGFFTHGSYFTIQAVPAVVGHTRNAAELYLAEFAARLTGDPIKAIPVQNQFTPPTRPAKL